MDARGQTSCFCLFLPRTDEISGEASGEARPLESHCSGRKEEDEGRGAKTPGDEERLPWRRAAALSADEGQAFCSGGTHTHSDTLTHLLQPRYTCRRRNTAALRQ